MSVGKMWKNMVRVITVVRVLTPCATVTTAMSVVAMIGRGHGSGKLTLMATDDVERFARVGEFFLNQKIDSSEVVRIDL